MPGQDPSAAAGHPSARPRVRRRRGDRRRNVVGGLAALVVLAFLAAFFAWLSAEPLWLAVGHFDDGTATVTTCTGTGVSRRCTASFTTTDRAVTVERVAMLGAAPAERRAGAAVPARMVSPDRCGAGPASCRAYAAGHPGLHLRWALGLLIVLCCGLGIAWTTGATRLDRGRRAAVAASLTAPLLLPLGFLAAMW
ncbi:MAG TPA: hypothetical protein VFM55_01530 [Micromonosporaceae bacterium]|nr:hypothetical protein [Micromonosporaceae bacterium]